MRLQLALDVSDVDRALSIARTVRDQVDVIEVGTPLLMAEGTRAVSELSQAHPEKPIVADAKIVDAGRYEAELMFDAGGDAVTVLSAAAEPTIRRVVETAQERDGAVVLDTINADVVESLERAERAGVDSLLVHRGTDQTQVDGSGPVGDLRRIADLADLPLAVAGGLNEDNVDRVVEQGATTVVVGSAISRASDPAAAASRIRATMEAATDAQTR
jgi:3-hexulose-6-phosphate synthase